jgi:hypothetical protein
MEAARPHGLSSDGVDADVLALPGIDVLLPTALLLRQPQMCRLVAEDAALTFETHQWWGRRPAWWRLVLRCRWLWAGAALDQRRAELRSFVAAYRADR